MSLFTTVDPRRIHFMGIAGAGMSGLALLAKEQGVAITGCDNDPTGAADLAANGVEIWRGHDPRGGGGGRGGGGAPAGPGGPPGGERGRRPRGPGGRGGGWPPPAQWRGGRRGAGGGGGRRQA